MLGLEARDLIRKREGEYKDLGLKDDSLSRAELIAAMVEHPRLIERPVAISGERAVLGRPIERVLELL
jgi:arsenate reductase